MAAVQTNEEHQSQSTKLRTMEAAVNYSYKQSFKDWTKHMFWVNDQDVISRLLLILPFYPKSDGRRTVDIIRTDVGDGNYLQEICIENKEVEGSESTTLAACSKDGSSKVKDIVLLHGYAASWGLFIYNLDSLSSIPGVRVHALDLLGFGHSSRPKFPKYTHDTEEDIHKVEDWFIDSLEEWRRKRNIEKFVLIGHSFGGYLSCAYAMKYNRQIFDTKTNTTLWLIDKLILVSPVGVERNAHSLLKNKDAGAKVSKAEQDKQNKSTSELRVSEELTADQEEIVNENVHGAFNPEEHKLLYFLWKHHFSPFSIVRNVGPLRSKFISRWTTRRFSHIYKQDPNQFQIMHDYIYTVFNGKGSGEYAITRVLAFGALARLPLIDRCPEGFVNMSLPTLFLYGDKDWMNLDAGEEMTKEINVLSQKKLKKDLAECFILPKAGHHLYLDNPKDFASLIFKFLGYYQK